MQLLLGTANPGKLATYQTGLRHSNLQLLTLQDINFWDEPLEIGKTYEENALQKARFYAEATEYPTLAEDGGLEIEALDGRPGIESRRWVGPHGTDEDRISKVLKLLVGVANRNAQFRLSAVIYLPAEREHIKVEASIAGAIANRPSQTRLPGFPYESLLFLPKIGKYYSDLTETEYELLNHRLKACRELLLKLEPYLFS